MKLLLVKRQKIWHDAGEIVEVSPAEANFLLSCGAAVELKETPEAKKQKRETRKK